jgi:peptidylprolyl isomerase
MSNLIEQNDYVNKVTIIRKGEAKKFNAVKLSTIISLESENSEEQSKKSTTRNIKMSVKTNEIF